MLMDATLRGPDGCVTEEWGITSDWSMPISDMARAGILKGIRDFDDGRATISATFTFADGRTSAFPFMNVTARRREQRMFVPEFRELLESFRDAAARQPRLIPRQVA